MSTIIIERIQIRCSLAKLAAMFLNGDISPEQYFEAIKSFSELQETKEKTV